MNIDLPAPCFHRQCTAVGRARALGGRSMMFLERFSSSGVSKWMLSGHHWRARALGGRSMLFLERFYSSGVSKWMLSGHHWPARLAERELLQSLPPTISSFYWTWSANGQVVSKCSISALVVNTGQYWRGFECVAEYRHGRTDKASTAHLIFGRHLDLCE